MNGNGRPPKAGALVKQGAWLWYSWLKEAWKPLAVLLVTAVLVFYMSASNRSTQSKLEAVALDTHTALCTFKADLERRYEDTKEYLEKHDGREPIPGVTRAALHRSLAGQKATLEALNTLDCTI